MTCPECGYRPRWMHQPERTPVERLQPGDQVKAVEHGPIGVVLRHTHGWTVVEYPQRTHHRRRGEGAPTMSYRHGSDELILVRTTTHA